MAEPKDGTSFFRKVVRFVANPATEWSDAATRQDDGTELEKSELKAMVERKRRNDFVRKRELDTLRKLRRDGLTPEQLAALGGSSRAADSEARQSEGPMARADIGVKAKIDEIEQQMAGEQLPRDMAMRQRAAPRRPPVAPQHPTDFYNAPTEPAAFDGGRPTPGAAPGAAPFAPASPAAPAAPRWQAPAEPAGLPPLPPLPVLPDTEFLTPAPARQQAAAPARQAPAGVVSTWSPASKAATAKPAARPPAGTPARAAPAPARTGTPSERPAAPAVAGLPRGDSSFGGSSRFAVEVNEVVHDPDLDEAVIAFANADFNQCEQALTNLCRPQAARANHAETWLVLFDLYRATGQQQTVRDPVAGICQPLRPLVAAVVLAAAPGGRRHRR